MKYFYTLVLLLAFTNAEAQQSFFNVPSSDITPKHKLFFQQQAGIIQHGVQLNTTFAYGLGHNFEAGINVLGFSDVNNRIVFSDYGKPYAPILALNFQKKFILTDRFSLGIGTQMGIDRKDEGGVYAYSNVVYLHEETGTKIVGGPYYSSDGFFGPETRNWTNAPTLKYIGLQAGIEQKIWKDKLLFQTDWISGKHAMGQIVAGAAYFVTPRWVVSAGWQMPTFGSKASNELVLELTYSPE